MVQVVLLSLVMASVAFTLCETTLFARLRESVKGRSAWVGKLACCGYCLGHWVGFGLMAIYHPRSFEAWWPLDYFPHRARHRLARRLPMGGTLPAGGENRKGRRDEGRAAPEAIQPIERRGQSDGAARRCRA